MTTALLCLMLSSALVTGQLAPSPQALLDRAVADFEQGRFAESATAFDSLAKAVPDQAPYLWQRGITLYYAGRYDGCRRQFESHRTVNPNDVENAVWHFLCVARAESPAKARAALLPVGPDARAPMREVYQMFRGTLTPEQVLSAAGSAPEAQFYAFLYTGLYLDALGMKDRALDLITNAAADRLARYGGYMHMVARVHLRFMTARQALARSITSDVPSNWVNDQGLGCFFAGGHARTKLPRFGICTFGSVFASITASAAITPLRCSRYAVNAYASALVSECGSGYGIARRMKSNTVVAYGQ